MDLLQHYDAMRWAAFHYLKQQGPEVDALLDSGQDTRRGITLRARPPAHVTALIGGLLADFQQVVPDQYYYPAPEIHLTVLSIISCYQGFTLDDINPADYQRAISAIVEQAEPFKIRFSGLTASPSSVMVQGLPQDNGLKRLRDQTRAFFQQSGLQQSIDQRYALQTAHATVIRFRNKLLDVNGLIEKIEQYTQQDLGVFEVDEVELVYNDWYHRAADTVILGRYSLLKT